MFGSRLKFCSENCYAFDLSGLSKEGQDSEKTTVIFATLLKNMACRGTERLVVDKVKTVNELASIAAEARANGRTVVFTNGCFDLLHRGHIHTLRQAKAQGDLLIVALNSDLSVRAIKGTSRPIMPESDRIELIAALEMVDYVVVYNDPDPYKLIAAIKPNVLAKGGDWSADKIIGADIVKKNGGRVEVIPYLAGFSTTEIIERIRDKNGEGL
jgi:rfaE bifunctional protein nucleotidyltransferase chain/domain